MLMLMLTIPGKQNGRGPTNTNNTNNNRNGEVKLDMSCERAALFNGMCEYWLNKNRGNEVPEGVSWKIGWLIDGRRV